MLSDSGESRTLQSVTYVDYCPTSSSLTLYQPGCNGFYADLNIFLLGTARYRMSVGCISQTTLIMLIAHVAISQRILQIRQARYGIIHNFVVCNKRNSQIRAECRTKHPGTKHSMPFFDTLDKTSRIDLSPGQNIPCSFVTPDKTSHAISATLDKTSHTLFKAYESA